MLPDNTAKPATPRYTTPMRALSGLFRTPTRLRTPTTIIRNKRTRARTSSVSPPTSTPCSPLRPAVVLQTYSVSTDSIVLTALSSAPFCCHEDLLTMSRPQLEGVVRAINARLPRRMGIGPEDDFWEDGQDGTGDDGDDGLSRMSEAEMRRHIEELVGIRAVVGKNRVSRSDLGLGTRAGVPLAPKAIRTRDAAWRPREQTPWEMESTLADDQSDDSNIMIEDTFLGSSPLASRTKTVLHVRGRNSVLPRLAILEEVNECGEPKGDDFEDDEKRPSKRQRLSFGSVAPDSEEGIEIVQEVRGSRLIENMDLSGSPLLARDDETSSEKSAEREESVVTPAINSDLAAATAGEEVQPPSQRRRSTRIKEIALKRSSPVDRRRKGASKVRDLKSSLLHSGSSAISSYRLSRNILKSPGEPGTEGGLVTPREFTIRLPFASTPPRQKSDSSVWSAPRILRSHSQRLLAASPSAKRKSLLGRSQSERYPRASDLAFVTIRRPRYRFTHRKSKGSKVAEGDQKCHSSESTTLEHGDSQLQQANEHEEEDLKVLVRNIAMGNPHTLPSVLCGALTPRSRAPSTSTVASTQANCGDSLARLTAKEGIAPNTNADSVVSDGVTERFWEALGRMVVDST